MKQALRLAIVVTLGLTTLLVGQLVIEILGWWWTGDSAALEAPFLNAFKFALAGSAGLGVSAAIGFRRVRRRRLL